MPVMIVGGRRFEYSKSDVEAALRGQSADPVQKHVAEINNSVFPPKQAIAAVTGWPRQSFTTQEAVRVLTGLGIVCRKPGRDETGRLVWAMDAGDEPETESDCDRINALEVRVAIQEAAIYGLAERVKLLEGV